MTLITCGSSDEELLDIVFKASRGQSIGLVDNRGSSGPKYVGGGLAPPLPSLPPRLPTPFPLRPIPLFPFPLFPALPLEVGRIKYSYRGSVGAL